MKGKTVFDREVGWSVRRNIRVGLKGIIQPWYTREKTGATVKRFSVT